MSSVFRRPGTDSHSLQDPVVALPDSFIMLINDQYERDVYCWLLAVFVVSQGCYWHVCGEEETHGGNITNKHGYKCPSVFCRWATTACLRMKGVYFRTTGRG